MSQDTFQCRLGEWFHQQGGALVDGILWQNCREAIALHAFGSDPPRLWYARRERGLSFRCQQQPAKSPGRIGECCRHGMQPMQPQPRLA